MEDLKRYLAFVPFLRTEEMPKSRFGINEEMVPKFSSWKKNIKLTPDKTMRLSLQLTQKFRYLKVEDHIVPLYPKREKPVREKLDNIPFEGTFNLRDEIKKVTFKEIEDEELEAVEYEVKKIEEEEIEQPYTRGEYLYKFLEKTPLKWQGQAMMKQREFRVQGSISADSKVVVVDLSENKSYNPIKHVRWHKTSHIISHGDENGLTDPLPLFEGFEWFITREAIGHYLNVIVFRGSNIRRSKHDPIRAKDLHFNTQKKPVKNYGNSSETDPDFEKYISEEVMLGPVYIPDHIAFQILNLICEEYLFCNIILLDRPRPLVNADSDEKADKSKPETKEKGNDKGPKKNSREAKKTKKDQDSDQENDKSNSEGEEKFSDSEYSHEDSDDSLWEEESGKPADGRGANKEKKKEKRGKKGENANKERESDSSSESDSESGSSSSSSSSSGSDSDYVEEDDYLAFKRETYRGTFESQLMDGRVKICYNTKRDEKKERRRKKKMLKSTNSDAKGNPEGTPEYKLNYHKSIELEFEQFFFVIEHQINKSIVKMIIFETEHRSYEIRFRIDPEMGRDNFYYAMIAFQACYRDQNYYWDEDLKNGNITKIKELVQQELETLSLKGYN
ncbi:hypothetical protein HWI79_2075 [Cryptosporidium felis]|nr:hypothetical protein HWI79_2075 [Cryptosporidium felis]